MTILTSAPPSTPSTNGRSPRRGLTSRLPLRNHPRWRIVVAAAVLLAIAAGVIRQMSSGQPAIPADRLYTVRRLPIDATVSASGPVVPVRQAHLNFRTTTGGFLDHLNVAAGDAVHAGQPLAQLQADDLADKLDAATAQLTQAQLKLHQLTETAAPQDVAAAQAAYDAAVAKYADLISGPTSADVATAQAAVSLAQSSAADAQAKLQTLENGATAADFVSAQSAVTAAAGTLQAAQARLDQLLAGPTSQDAAGGQAALDQAQAGLRGAVSKLEAVRGSTQADLATAQTELDQVQATARSSKAKLDQLTLTAAVPADVALAQANLAAAATTLQTAHQGLDQLSAQLSLAQATVTSQQSALSAARQTADATCSKFGGSSAECADAKSKVDQLQPQLLQNEQQVKLLLGSGSWDQLAAQKALLAAQAGYDSAASALKQAATARQVPADLIMAQSTHDAAVSALTSAGAKLDQARVQTQTNLATAQADVDAANAGVAGARAKLETMLLGSSSADLVAAQTTVDSAQATFDAAKSKLDALGQPTVQDLNAARIAAQSAAAGLRSAQAKLDQLNAGPLPGDLESARSAMSAAAAGLVDKSGTGLRQSDIAIQEAAVRQAEVAVHQAKRDLDAATLVAPFDGVVASVGCAVGEQVPCAPASTSSTGGSGVFLVLVDLSHLQVQATIGEADVARVQPGQVARFTFDAFPGRIFQGTVASLSTQGASNQGAVTYGVTLDLDTAGSAVPPGLTASATIVVNHKDAALAVPPEALRREGHGVILDVLGPDGTLQPRTVQVGIERDTAVEIASGVEEGDQIVLPVGTTVSALAALTD